MNHNITARVLAWAGERYKSLRVYLGGVKRKTWRVLDQETRTLSQLRIQADQAALAGDREVELHAWRQVRALRSADIAVQIRYGQLLRLNNRLEKAEAHFQCLLGKRPESEKVLAELARTAMDSRDYDLAVNRWRALTAKYPGSIGLRKSYIRALLSILAFDEAQAVYDGHVADQPDIGSQLLQSNILLARSQVQAAHEVVDKVLALHPESMVAVGRKVHMLTQLFRSTGNPEHASEALTLLDNYQNMYGAERDLLESRIVINVLLSRRDEALRLIGELPENRTKTNLELRAWALYQQGNIEGSKQLWRGIIRRYYPNHVAPLAAASFKQLDANTVVLEPDSIVLFTAVRNERWRLAWFLAYYRTLGVERFFFVDNGSDDGTTDYLLEQSDVHVFWTEQSYAQACSGIQWINWLVEQYGAECWCIYADVDEALVFPGSEARGLRYLTRYMGDRGYEAMPAFMLDMYAPYLQSIGRDNDYTGFIRDYPLFENEYSCVGSLYCPFRFIVGGIRRTFKASENQTKTPIIRGGRGIRFLMSSHYISPARLSDVTGVLLHYKLAGDFEQSFSDDLLDNTRIPACKARHRRYTEALEELPESESFVRERTVSYGSSTQLVELDLMETSSEFENHGIG